MSTWDSTQPPPSTVLSGPERRRALGRLAVLVIGLLPALTLLGMARALEVMTHAGDRRFSPRVAGLFSRYVLWVIGMSPKLRGTPMQMRGAFVANHASWLDIFVLNAATPVMFVAKSEVAGWAGIGLLARLAGTVFIRRDRRDAQAQTQVLAAEFRRGHHLAFFPEGTSTDSTLVLPFKPTLFQAFLADGMPADLAVQPVSLRYHAPNGADPRFYGWWGGMDFASHFMRILGQKTQGSVTVEFHTCLPCAETTGRKALAAQSEALVRQGFARG
jgi:1-acyl-sn-glycerol-3-phosphate acyltransferase